MAIAMAKKEPQAEASVETSAGGWLFPAQARAGHFEGSPGTSNRTKVTCAISGCFAPCAHVRFLRSLRGETRAGSPRAAVPSDMTGLVSQPKSIPARRHVVGITTGLVLALAGHTAHAPDAAATRTATVRRCAAA